jgi:hypothetical protein
MTARDLRRARMALFGHFFVLGAATATWSARLPAIKEALHLSDGALGLVLFAVPAGSVLTLMLSGRIVDRFGAARVLRIAGLLVAVALVLIGLGPQFRSLPVLVIALAWFGVVAGLLDVSMNTCAARLEAAYGRPIMSSLHAGYSIAGLAGAGIGGIFAALALGPLPTFAAVGPPLAVFVLLAGPWIVLPPVPAEAVTPGDQPARSPGQLAAIIWVLGLLALAGQLGEGSAGDWSAVYLHTNLGTSAGVAAVGLAAFSVTMAAGRLAGDRLSARFGSVALVRASGLVAGLGLAAGLLIVTSAARLDPARAGRNIGRIAAVAYTGLLTGPVAIGAAASGVGLRDALLIPAALAVGVAAAAGVLSPHRTARTVASAERQSGRSQAARRS